MDRVVPNRNFGRQLSQTVALQKIAPARTSGGGYTDDYTTVASVAGRVSPQINSRALEAAMEGGERRTKDFVQIVADVSAVTDFPDSNWRLVCDSRTYEILACTDAEGLFVALCRRIA